MGMQEDSIRERLVLANQGDEAAYRAFLRQIAPLLRAFARSAVVRARIPAADADDIIQETLIAIHQKRHTYDPQYPVMPWLRGIARHKLLDALRRRRIDHVPIEPLQEILSDPVENRGLLLGDVARLTMLLPDHQKRAIIAVAEGYSGAIAAARLHMSEGAFRVALHRGIKQLRKALEG